MEILQQIHSQISKHLPTYEQIVQKSFSVDKEQAKNIVTAELTNYISRLRLYLNDPQHQRSGTPTLALDSAVNIFIEVMQNGLSFSTLANHVYLSRMKGTGMNVGFQITAEGEIYRAQRSGAIDHCSEVVLVLNGEFFEIVNTPDGRHVANHTLRFDGRPKFSADIFVVGYVYLVYPNGNRELSWMSKERLLELRAKGQSPAMYNDESFVKTKIIKHALKKVRKTVIPLAGEIDDDFEDLTSTTVPLTTLPPQMEQPWMPEPQFQQPAPAATQYQPQYQQPQYQQPQQFNQPSFQEPF